MVPLLPHEEDTQPIVTANVANATWLISNVGETMNESWNLDRKPTATERATGVIGALLLGAASGVCLWFSVTFLKSIWASVLSSAFAIFSVFMLYRFIFTGARKLGRPEITKLARVFAVAGIIMVIGSFFADGLQSRLLLLSLGLFGIGGGALNLSKRKEENSFRFEVRQETGAKEGK